MNRFLFLTTSVFMLTMQKAFCLTEAVSPDLDESLKTQSGDPSVFHIIFALLFVLALIYVTGIIYSKLNIVGAKTLKDQLKNSDINRAIVVSTTQLGQNKNLHVIEINNKSYLIGATPNSINLIKDLGDVKADESEDKPKNESSDEDIDKAIKCLYGRSNGDIIEQNHPDEDEFNIHKKYL